MVDRRPAETFAAGNRCLIRGAAAMMLQSAESFSQSVQNLQGHRFSCAAFWLLHLVLAGAISSPGPVWAQSAAKEAPIEFSIPEQPLISAISRYGATTGSEAVYDASLAIGRISSSVQGVLTPTEALERLLAGTGLSARFVSEGMFVVLPAQIPTEQSVVPGPSPSAANSRYYALIQETLLDALCRASGTRPGRYRIIAVFSIAPTGALEKARRIGGAGDPDIDRQIDAALSSVKFTETPPEGFAQPVRILIVPDAPGVNLGCTAADARLHARAGAR